MVSITSIAGTISPVSSATWRRSSDPGSGLRIRLPRSILGLSSVPSMLSTSLMSYGPELRQSRSSKASRSVASSGLAGVLLDRRRQLVCGIRSLADIINASILGELFNSRLVLGRPLEDHARSLGTLALSSPRWAAPAGWHRLVFRRSTRSHHCRAELGSSVTATKAAILTGWITS